MKTAPKPACRMNSAAPYFLVDDVFATAEFYRDVLGFSFNQFFGEPPSFVLVERDDVRIMFRQVRPAKPAVARTNASVMDKTYDAYLYVSDVDRLAEELRAKNADIVEGPVDRLFGMRELVVRDCNGYRIAVGQDSLQSSQTISHLSCTDFDLAARGPKDSNIDPASAPS